MPWYYKGQEEDDNFKARINSYCDIIKILIYIYIMTNKPQKRTRRKISRKRYKTRKTYQTRKGMGRKRKSNARKRKSKTRKRRVHRNIIGGAPQVFNGSLDKITYAKLTDILCAFENSGVPTGLCAKQRQGGGARYLEAPGQLISGVKQKAMDMKASVLAVKNLPRRTIGEIDKWCQEIFTGFEYNEKNDVLKINILDIPLPIKLTDHKVELCKINFHTLFTVLYKGFISDFSGQVGGNPLKNITEALGKKKDAFFTAIGKKMPNTSSVKSRIMEAAQTNSKFIAELLEIIPASGFADVDQTISINVHQGPNVWYVDLLFKIGQREKRIRLSEMFPDTSASINTGSAQSDHVADTVPMAANSQPSTAAAAAAVAEAAEAESAEAEAAEVAAAEAAAADPLPVSAITLSMMNQTEGERLAQKPGKLKKLAAAMPALHKPALHKPALHKPGFLKKKDKGHVDLDQPLNPYGSE